MSPLSLVTDGTLTLISIDRVVFWHGGGLEYIPVDQITIQAKCINPPMTSFEKFHFNRSDWINLSQSFQFTNWIHDLDQVSPDAFLPVAMNILISKCSIHMTLKRPKETRKYKYQKERRV